MAASHKSNQYLLGIIKFLVLSIGVGYLFFKLREYASQDFMAFINATSFDVKTWISFLSVLFVLTATNWILEILKWKTLANTVRFVSFGEAIKQSLAALTVSLATPARIGDYGAKAMYFRRENRKKIVALNLFSNMAQLAATVFFGIFGLIFCLIRYPIPLALSNVFIVSAVVIIAVFLAYSYRKKIWFKGFSILKTIHFFGKLPLRTRIHVLGYAFARYLVFSLMFYLILVFFGASIDTTTAFLLIFTSYLLVSLLPTMLILDVVIRGSVALWLFSFEVVPELIVLSAVFFMWLFNFVFPALIGSIYVVRFQPVTE